MRRAVVVGVCTLGLLGLGAGAASAGEITGNGKETPIKTRYVAASECAFSGLNDYQEELPPGVEPQRVQNFAELVHAGIPPKLVNPGMFCNPTWTPPAEG